MPRCTKCEFAYREDELMCGELCWDCAEEVMEDNHKKLVELTKDCSSMAFHINTLNCKLEEREVNAMMVVLLMEMLWSGDRLCYNGMDDMYESVRECALHCTRRRCNKCNHIMAVSGKIDRLYAIHTCVYCGHEEKER